MLLLPRVGEIIDNGGNISVSEGGRKLYVSREILSHIFHSHAPSARPFVFDSTYNMEDRRYFGRYDERGDFLVKETNLPFKVMWFEHVDHKPLVVARTEGVGEEPEVVGVLTVQSLNVIVAEKAYSGTTCFLLSRSDSGRETLHVSDIQLGSVAKEYKTLGSPGAAAFSRVVIEGLLSVISGGEKEECTTEYATRIKKPRKLGGGCSYIKNVVLVRPPVATSTPEPKPCGAVAWSHQWEVRGHVRKIRGFGKDSTGSITKGWTWVRNCVKGPENKPLVKKVRVVAPTNNNSCATSQPLVT